MYRRPESVLVVIYTASGEVLQLRRREPPDYWQSVTGSLLEHETPLQAARREVREETGLLADAGLSDSGIVNRYPIHPAWASKFAPGVASNTEYVFALSLDRRGDILLESGEHLEYRWLPRDQAAAQASSATDRAAIAALVPPFSVEE